MITTALRGRILVQLTQLGLIIMHYYYPLNMSRISYAFYVGKPGHSRIYFDRELNPGSLDDTTVPSPSRFCYDLEKNTQFLYLINTLETVYLNIYIHRHVVPRKHFFLIFIRFGSRNMYSLLVVESLMNIWVYAINIHGLWRIKDCHDLLFSNFIDYRMY